jgi:hypothetical protein
MLDQLTESPTADVPSANPLALLSLRQLVVFLVRAHQRPLTQLADLLGLSRETVHLELRSAIQTLSERGPQAPARPAAAPGRPYRCVDHEGGCPAYCSYLRRWLASPIARCR